ncbi:M48 family metalloprotease [Moraxella canis]|uniref:M48 family metalloprotease n=1 Tax=Moraxella canis TaxID=90239 RepID=UPI0006656BE6|nr:M48 family metalloprotease [Moraxella canis]
MRHPKVIRCVIMAALMGSGAGATVAFAQSGPVYQGQSAYQMPAATTQGFYDKHRNEQIAAWSLRQINASLPLIRDPWVNQVIAQMSAQMNATVRTVPLYHTVVITDNNINAFAVPGGLIGINAGTVMAAQAVDEMASVIAHEIAHISQRHYEHRLDNNKRLLALQLGGLLAAIAASAAGGGDAVLAVMASSQTASAENAAKFSREHEREADRVGMQILAQSGFDARAMPRFFGRMQRQLNLNQSKNAFIPSFVQSHPFTAERLSESTARAQAYAKPNQAALQSQAVLFDQLYWRIKYLTEQTTHAELLANAKHSDGAKLSLAMNLSDQGRHQEALHVFDAIQLDRYDPIMCLTQAYVHSQARQYDDALAALEPCQRIYPERRDLRLALAEVCIDQDQPVPALGLLGELTKDGSFDIQAWQISFRAYEQMANQATDPAAKAMAQIHALRTRSQVELWQAQYDRALQSIAQAEQVARSSNHHALLTMLNHDKNSVLAARDFKP